MGAEKSKEASLFAACGRPIVARLHVAIRAQPQQPPRPCRQRHTKRLRDLPAAEVLGSHLFSGGALFCGAHHLARKIPVNNCVFEGRLMSRVSDVRRRAMWTNFFFVANFHNRWHCLQKGTRKSMIFLQISGSLIQATIRRTSKMWNSWTRMWPTGQAQTAPTQSGLMKRWYSPRALPTSMDVCVPL